MLIEPFGSRNFSGGAECGVCSKPQEKTLRDAGVSHEATR